MSDIELKPCPFCADPMKVAGMGTRIEHRTQTPGCPMRDLSLPIERIDDWNMRNGEAVPQQWRGIESAPKLITKNAALHAIRSLMHERPDESEKHRNWAILQAIDAVESLPATGADQ